MLPSPLHLKPDYGVDYPHVVRGFVIVGCSSIFLSFIFWQFSDSWQVGFTRVVIPLLFFLGMPFLIAGLVMLHGSRRGKLVLCDRLISQLQLIGNEQVLDVGSGRGLLLIGIANQLTTGRAVGIDLWQSSDQSDNEITTTEENTRRANVADRVELHIGDMSELSFADGRFDVVVSSWAIHHVSLKDERKQVIEQMWRVLKSGGKLALIDTSYTTEYEACLKQLGCTTLTKHGPYFTFLRPSYLLQGTKP